MKEKLIDLHKRLTYYRYNYYEKDNSLISDYDYDMLEKGYDILCDELEIPIPYRVTSFIGFDVGIPRNPYNYIKFDQDEKLNRD